jgi:hypothetical protein
MKFRILAWLLIFAILGCSSDDEETPEFTPQEGSQIIIGNQGFFLATDASLTLYNESTGEITQDVYAAANGGEAIGDVLQSMYLYNDELYVVMNNSSKVEVLDPNTFLKKRVIQGFNSPRYIAFLSPDKAYVTDLFSNNIHIINPTTGTYSGIINTGFWVEEMVEVDGDVWCTAPSENKVIIIDPTTDAITDQIALPSTANASDILLDAHNDVWVMCQGNFSAPLIEPTIVRIDAATLEIEATYLYPENTGFGGNIELSHTDQELYILMHGNVSKMSISATELPSETFIAREGQPFYGISVNPESGDIYVGVDIDNMSYIYDSDGSLKYEIESGVLPWTAVWN